MGKSNIISSCQIMNFSNISTNEDETLAVVEKAIDIGVNHFDLGCLNDKSYPGNVLKKVKIF